MKIIHDNILCNMGEQGTDERNVNLNREKETLKSLYVVKPFYLKSWP